MVKYNRDAVFHALADDTRRRILDLLSTTERSAGDLAGRFTVTWPAISRHLRVLREAGLVEQHKRAQQRIYRLSPDALREVDRWLERYRVFWSARMQDLRRYVEEGR